MKNRTKGQPLWLALVVPLVTVPHVRAQTGTSNMPPRVSLPWPCDGYTFSGPNWLRLRADVTPGSRPIAFVQFLVNTNPIATVTNPPYATMWWATNQPPSAYGRWDFEMIAAAVDTADLRAESAPAHLLWLSDPWTPIPALEITSPQAGAIFAAPATFSFSADLPGGRH